MILDRQRSLGLFDEAKKQSWRCPPSRRHAVERAFVAAGQFHSTDFGPPTDDDRSQAETLAAFAGARSTDLAGPRAVIDERERPG